MFGPAFTALWLISLVIVAAVVLRFALMSALTVWLMFGEALEARALRLRLVQSANATCEPRSMARINLRARRTLAIHDASRLAA